MEKEYCTAVVLAAGRGKRMGARVAKQYLEIENRPLLFYALSAFEKSKLIDSIVLVVGDTQQIAYCKKNVLEAYGFQKVDMITVGGRERYDSVRCALRAIRGEQEAAKCEVIRPIPDRAQNGYVFLHDGARPVLTEDILARCLEAVKQYGVCAAAMPAKDTVKIADENGFAKTTPPRDLVWTIQTPQTFAFPLIYGAYEKMETLRPEWEKTGLHVTDDAMVVETFTDRKVKLVEGSYENIKVTTPEDLNLAGLFLAKKP